MYNIALKDRIMKFKMAAFVWASHSHNIERARGKYKIRHFESFI